MLIIVERKLTFWFLDRVVKDFSILLNMALLHSVKFCSERHISDLKMKINEKI